MSQEKRAGEREQKREGELWLIRKTKLLSNKEDHCLGAYHNSVILKKHLDEQKMCTNHTWKGKLFFLSFKKLSGQDDKWEEDMITSS